MTYNIVKKNQPNLIDYQLTKKLARMNNIDIKTGLMLNNDTNQFSVLLKEIKNCIICTLRKNWSIIISLLIISYLLYQRYNNVKVMKLQKAEEDRINEIKFQEYRLEKQNQKNAMDKINSLHSQYEHFDDTKTKERLYDKPIVAMNEMKMNHGYGIY